MATDFWILDIADLKRTGVLSREECQQFIDVGTWVHVAKVSSCINVTVPLVKYELARDFSIDDDRFWHTSKVKIVYRDLRYGLRPYFSCPLSGDDCLKLVISGKIICSKPAWKGLGRGLPTVREVERLEVRRRLLKVGGRSRLSSLERERHIAKVLEHPEWALADPELREIIDKDTKRRQRQRRKFEWESRALSTSKALAEGRGLAQHPLFAEYNSWEDAEVAAIPPPVYERPSYSGWTHDYPELDIKVLLERFDLYRSALRGIKLGWTVERTSGYEVHMFVDGRFSDVPQLVFAFIDAETRSRHWQKVDLLPGPNSSKARYFLCPVTRARSETLYLRNGMFASHQAQQLRADKSWTLSPPSDG